MTEALNIRPLAANDISVLLPLAHGAFVAAYGAHNSNDLMTDYANAAFSVPQFEKELSDPDSYFIGVFENELLMGFVKLKHSTAPGCVEAAKTIEIERIYTAASETGRGIGHLLMEAAVDCAKQLQQAAIWLGVWQENSRAVAFYEREGFAIKGEKVFMLGSDAQRDHVMVKYI